MIIGIGSDITDIRRVEKVIERHGERFLARIFTEAERARAERRTTEAAAEWEMLRVGALLAQGLGLEVHAGHGLDYASAETIAALPQIMELNIGHFLIGEAVFEGLDATIKMMRAAMDRGRAKVKA